MKKVSIIVLLMFGFSAFALTKSQMIETTTAFCQNQLAMHKQDAVGLMLLNFLTLEAPDNRQILLLQVQLKKNKKIAEPDIPVVDYTELCRQLQITAKYYIKKKDFRKAVHLLTMSDKIGEMSEESLIYLSKLNRD